jgi:F-type H+-transporting ATPase subunit delta
MSASSLVAKRYARALFYVAKEKALVAEVEQSLQLISSVLKSDSQLIAFLAHPGFELKQKYELIEKVFGKTVNEHVLDTLKLMCDRRRTAQIEDLSLHYSKIASHELGQANAEVVSAKALTEKELLDIGTTFTRILGKEVRLTSSVNENLIGGIQVRVGDTLYDGTIAGKLSRLQKSLQESQAL